MTTGLRFRNVDVDPASPVEQWPDEALDTALDRGSISDWRRIAAAIRADPWGRVARAVESIAQRGEHDGVDQLMMRVITRARCDVNLAARDRYAAVVRGARRRTGLSLREFARLAGTSASRLSDYENARTAPTTDVLGRIEEIAQRHEHALMDS
jgi:DNA-binding transcriptional regulator YiaG